MTDFPVPQLRGRVAIREAEIKHLHEEINELREAFNTQRRVIVLQRETLQRILQFAKQVDSAEADSCAAIAREGLYPKS